MTDVQISRLSNNPHTCTALADVLTDVVADGGSVGFYAGLGYHCAGEIPGFTLRPHGGLTGTQFF